MNTFNRILVLIRIPDFQTHYKMGENKQISMIYCDTLKMAKVH